MIIINFENILKKQYIMSPVLYIHVGGGVGWLTIFVKELVRVLVSEWARTADKPMPRFKKKQQKQQQNKQTNKTKQTETNKQTTTTTTMACVYT